MKEEKEVLEHFAGVFTMMNPLTFKEIFQTTVPYMVERISKNYALQVQDWAAVKRASKLLR
jgi:transformation/transcription domain-associated protein